LAGGGSSATGFEVGGGLVAADACRFLHRFGARARLVATQNFLWRQLGMLRRWRGVLLRRWRGLLFGFGRGRFGSVDLGDTLTGSGHLGLELGSAILRALELGLQARELLLLLWIGAPARTE
jgi:hypothetical protein